MAKKAAAAAATKPAAVEEDSIPLKEVPSFTEPGKGRRLCVACEAEGKKDKYATARGTVCKYGHVKPESPKLKIASGTRSSKSESGPDAEKLAMEFVLFENSGNIEKAYKAVEGYKEDSLAQFIANCGGIDNAKNILDTMLKKKAGG